jgi:uncharacterized membrane protein
MGGGAKFSDFLVVPPIPLTMYFKNIKSTKMDELLVNIIQICVFLILIVTLIFVFRYVIIRFKKYNIDKAKAKAEAEAEAKAKERHKEMLPKREVLKKERKFYIDDEDYGDWDN